MFHRIRLQQTVICSDKYLLNEDLINLLFEFKMICRNTQQERCM